MEIKERVTTDDLNVLCKPSMINLLINRIIDYLYSGEDLSYPRNEFVSNLRKLDYCSKVSLAGYLFHDWNAVFNDLCSGDDNYIDITMLLIDDIHDFLDK